MAGNVTGWRRADNSDSSSPAYCSRFLFTVQDMFFADSISSAGTKAEQRTKSWRTFSVCPHFCQPACCTPYSVPGSENGSSVISFAGGVNRKVYCKRLLNFICLPQSIIQSLRSKACWILSPGGSNCRKCVHCSMSNKTQLKYVHYERSTETCKKHPATHHYKPCLCSKGKVRKKYCSWAIAIFVTVCRKLPEENCL